MADLILRGVGVPVAVAIIVWIAVLRPWRGRRTAVPRCTSGIASALACTSGFYALWGWPGTLPVESWAWLAHLMLPVSVLGAWPAARVTIRTPLVVLIGLCCAWLLVPGFVAPHRAAWVIGVGVLMAATYGAITVVARRTSPAAVAALLMLGLTGGSILLARYAGNAKLGQLLGALAGPVGVCMVAALWRPRAVSTATLAGPVAVAHVGLLACGYFNNYSQTPAVAFVLVTLAPMVPILGVAIGLTRPPGYRRAALSIGLCVALSVSGLILAERAMTAAGPAY